MRARRVFLAGAAALLVAPFLVPIADAEAPSPGAYTTAPAISGGPAGRVALGEPWTVRTDRHGHGAAKGWQAGAFAGGADVAVPFSPNADKITGLAGLRSFRGSIAWYRTTFSVPADGVYALRFESVNHRSTVWLDGKRLGSHKGHYLPFEFRSFLRTGRSHTLVVRADWRGPAAMKADGWHRTWFNFGGIHREVTVRPIGQAELTAPTFRTRLRDGRALVDVTVHVRNYGPIREVPVEGALVREGVRIPLTFPTLAIREKGTKIFHAQAEVADPALWSPEAPNLYDLELSVPGEASYSTRVGLRELTWDGPRLLLN
ncbi:MAG: hypothetical protein M3141_05215, partial [Actinomycetota bacterium]|nr:hypothetical protein [Actinomycetota bacterium]